MPVANNGIGESSNTPIKNETVSALFSAWCSQVTAIRKRLPLPVVLIDLTAGRGQQANGSPSFIADARWIATERGLPLTLVACEESEENAIALRSYVDVDHLYQCRWQHVTAAIANHATRAFAFIYHDPNTCCKEHPELIALAGACTRADFCLHFDANQIKRIRCAGIDVATISDLIGIRKHCLIRQPFGTGSQWTVLYLSHCRIKGYTKYGFYELGADETGDGLLRRMQYTHAERIQMNGQKELNFGY